MGVETLDFGFATPKTQKALPYAEPRRLTYFASKSVTRLGCSLSQKPKKVAESLFVEGREITHAQNRNP